MNLSELDINLKINSSPSIGSVWHNCSILLLQIVFDDFSNFITDWKASEIHSFQWTEVHSQSRVSFVMKDSLSDLVITAEQWTVFETLAVQEFISALLQALCQLCFLMDSLESPCRWFCHLELIDLEKIVNNYAVFCGVSCLIPPICSAGTSCSHIYCTYQMLRSIQLYILVYFKKKLVSTHGKMDDLETIN